MAELFLAQDTSAGGRLVVIKRILPYLSTEAEFVRMFLDEARIAAQLDHPNIVHTFELGKLDDTIFIAMEYVEGIDLRKVLQEEQRRKAVVPWRLAAFLTAEVAAALGAAHHSRGIDGRPMEIIHRDISPQNVMLAYDGSVKLVDFGIAKATTLVQNSKPGVIKGKFLYLSPEQLTQERLDSRSDLFPLGSMLYEAVTGQSPFYKATTEAIIYAIRHEEPPPPQLVRPSLPAELSRIVMRCLTKDREYRYQDALDVERDLRALLAREAPTAALDLAGYIGSLFGEEEDRTVLHMPAAPRGRTHETLPLASGAAKPQSSVTAPLPAPRKPSGENPFESSEATALASPEMMLGDSDDRTELAPRGALEALLAPRKERGSAAANEQEKEEEATASTAAERPLARGGEGKRRSRADVPATPLTPRSSRTASGERAGTRRRTSEGLQGPVRRTTSGVAASAAPAVSPRSRSYEGLTATKPTATASMTEPTPAPDGFRRPSGEQALSATRAPFEDRPDATFTGPLDPHLLLEDLTPPPPPSPRHPRVGEDEESTMNYPPAEEEDEARRHADYEDEATGADAPERSGLYRLSLVLAFAAGLVALVLGTWLLWPRLAALSTSSALDSATAAPLARDSAKAAADAQGAPEVQDGAGPAAAAMVAAEKDTAEKDTAEKDTAEKPAAEGQVNDAAAESDPAAAATEVRTAAIRLLAPRGTRIWAGGKRLALATPLTFPEGRLTLKVRCPGRRSRRRTQTVELRAEEAVVRPLAFCGAKIPK